MRRSKKKFCDGVWGRTRGLRSSRPKVISPEISYVALDFMSSRSKCWVLWLDALSLSSKIKERDISFIYRACFIVHQGLKSEIYYTFIPLVSSHRCLKNEVCCTFILLVSSHDGLKNKVAETLYSTKINFLCAVRLMKFERHDPAFRARWLSGDLTGYLGT